MKPITKRPSFLILTIKEDGEQIVLRSQDGTEIASIVARPHRGRVKVGVAADSHIVITREERPISDPSQDAANGVCASHNEKSRTSPRQGRGEVALSENEKGRTCPRQGRGEARSRSNVRYTRGGQR